MGWTFGPYLHLDDARAAIDWYVRALGAVVRECHEMENGKIGHAELDLHGNLLCLADCPTDAPAPLRYSDVAIGLYAVVPDRRRRFQGGGRRRRDGRTYVSRSALRPS